MSGYIKKKIIKYDTCGLRTDHSEKVLNRIKELVVVELSAIAIVNARDSGVIL